MDISSYVLLSHEQALRRRLDVVANNLANTSTVGFRREQPVFHEMVRGQGGDATADKTGKVSFVLDHGAVHDTRGGAFQATGNPLDVMIDGPGYLTVASAEGAPAYTRAGHLKVLEDGRLAAAGGEPVLGDGGQPIVIPAEALGQLRIGEDGTVIGPDGPLGRIGLTVFDDEAAVDPRGDGLFSGTGGRLLAAAETLLKSGGVEGSNVQPISETTQMIEILRSYQTSQRLAADIADMRKRAIERLGRVGN